MEIENTTPVFFGSKDFELNDYYRSFPDLFGTYFNGYCEKTDEKVASAVERYPGDYDRLKKISGLLHGVIEKASKKAEAFFGFPLDVRTHIFIGLYASNAFAGHNGDLYFAVEKLVCDPGFLEVIVTHEIIGLDICELEGLCSQHLFRRCGHVFFSETRTRTQGKCVFFL